MRCAISMDMDPLWYYLNAKRYSTLQSNSMNGVYDNPLPRFLDLFNKYFMNVFFFLVEKDADRSEK